VIGQAIGILMERYALTEDGAFGYLTRVSSHTNVKPRAVAQMVVDQRNDTSTRLGHSNGTPGPRGPDRAPAGGLPRRQPGRDDAESPSK
jgi:hypothetical protein